MHVVQSEGEMPLDCEAEFVTFGGFCDMTGLTATKGLQHGASNSD